MAAARRPMPARSPRPAQMSSSPAPLCSRTGRPDTARSSRRSARRRPPGAAKWREGSREMIPRYSRAAMAAIWEPQTRFRIQFEIEAHAATRMAKLGIIPQEAADKVWAKGKDAIFDVERIDEIEREV